MTSSKHSKILFILHLPPPTHGSSVVGKQIQNSDKINSTFSCKYINLNTSKKISHIGRWNPSKFFSFFKIVFSTFVSCIFRRPDLCYLAITAKGIAFLKDAVIALIVKAFGIKIVYHFHNKGVHLYSQKKLYNVFYKLVFKNSDAILLSKYLYPDIQRYFPKERIHICPNGIPEPKECNRGYNSHSNKIPRILFISNLIESKGVLTLLNACKILASQNIPFQGVFAGNEGDISRKQLEEEICNAKLEEHVKYVGAKYGEEKERFFMESDVFAFPTFYDNECFPLVLLEAQSFFLPSISTYEGGIPDIIDNERTGFLIKKQNAEELAQKLQLLIENKDLRFQMGQCAYQKYNRNFTLKIFENSMTSIIVSLLNQ
ncbi:MAG: glycosyltransferase family 4 protein [Deltaproteobacteria bacterium]|nr:glycosyltransferase family 4 protein [Deltaproteobacteria bacterium]